MDIYIYGAGNNGRKTLEYMKQFVKINIKGFIDKNYRTINKIEGIPVICIEKAIEQGARDKVILVSPQNNDNIINMLHELGFYQIVNVVPLLNTVYPYFIPKKVKADDYSIARPFNWYESPYADLEKIHKQEKDIFSSDRDVQGISLNIVAQLELLDQMSMLSLSQWDSSNHRYTDNSWFGKSSASILAHMMQILNPNRIIEVGSGYSTAVMLDINEIYFNNEIKIQSIEPYPDRLKSLLKENDKLEVQEEFLENIPLTLFEQLQENDILFIDSSHVSKINSDVNYLFFEILPRLNKGVYIHIHDIYWPFEYPKRWIYEGRAYTEAYMLRAFLMDNQNYSIVLFMDMLKKNCADKINSAMRDCVSDGSIWIRKEV